LKSRDDDGSEEIIAKDESSKHKKKGEIQVASFEDLGLTVRDLRSSEEKQFKLNSGVLITKVKRFSKAENQRLFAGLVITEVDREKIESVEDFEDIINDKKGEAALLKVVDSEGTSRFVGLVVPE
jgi:serine protease Do